MTCRGEIADGGSRCARLRRRLRAMGRRRWGIRIVMVPNFRVSLCARCFEKGPRLRGCQVSGGRTLDPDRSADSMKIARARRDHPRACDGNGRTFSKLHSRLPHAAHSSKSCGVPRSAIWPLTAELPPVTLPRGYGISRDGVACATKPQSCGPAEIQVFSRSAGVCPTVE